MNDEMEQQEPPKDEQTSEPHGEEEAIDWKGESRKWEKLAKQNKEAAAELEALKQERMSEQEKLQARAEKAEAELNRIAAEHERVKSAQEVAKASEVPLDLLMFCSSKDEMERFVEVYKAQMQQTQAAPRRQASRIVRDTETPAGNRDVFAEMMENL